MDFIFSIYRGKQYFAGILRFYFLVSYLLIQSGNTIVYRVITHSLTVGHHGLEGPFTCFF